MILAIDIGQNMGIAWLTDCGELRYDCVKLKKRDKEHHGKRFVMLREFLEELPQLPEVIYYERVRRHLGTDAAHDYGGYVAVLRMYCFQNYIPLKGIGVATVKKYATGNGRADKSMMIEAAKKEFGYDGKNDNEADALWILSAGLESERKDLCQQV